VVKCTAAIFFRTVDWILESKFLESTDQESRIQYPESGIVW